jgi:TP901 family phage tail tape measure protein
MRAKAATAANLPAPGIISQAASRLPNLPQASSLSEFARQSGFQAVALQRQIAQLSGQSFRDTGRQIRPGLEAEFENTLRQGGASDEDLAQLKAIRQAEIREVRRKTENITEGAALEERLNALAQERFGVEQAGNQAARQATAATQESTRRRLSGAEQANADARRRNQLLRERAGQDQFVGPRRTNVLEEENARLEGQIAGIKQQRAAAERRKFQAASRGVVAENAEAQVQAQINAQKARNLQLEARNQPQLLQARAQEVILRNQQNAQLRRAVQIEARRQGLGLGQRAQLAAQGGGRGGQAGFLAGGLASTLRFAIPSAALFGAARGVSALIENGKELELVFNRITAQFEQLSSSGQDFSGLFGDDALNDFQEGIIDISRETGVAATVVGDLAESFVGLFVEQGPETGLALTEIAVQLAVITDLEPGEAFNDLGAALRAFVTDTDDVVQVATQISDTVIAIRNSTGVAGDELTDFVSRVAALGVEAGGSVQQLTALGATIQQASGVGGAALAEQFGRILSGFSSGVGREIFELSQNIDGLDISAEDVNAGRAIPVLEELIRAYDGLNDAQRTQIRTQLGGRREGATLVALLNNNNTAIRLLEDGLIRGGEAQDDFNRRQETLSQQLRQLGASFQELGIRLFEAGLSDLLIGFVNALEALVTIADATVIPVLEVLADLLGALPDGFGGAALGAVALGAALRSTRGGVGGVAANVTGVPAATLAQRVQFGVTSGSPAGLSAAEIDRLRPGAGVRGRVGALRGAVGGSSIAQIGATLGATFAVGQLFDEVDGFNTDLSQAAEDLRQRLSTSSAEQRRVAIEVAAVRTESNNLFVRGAQLLGFDPGQAAALRAANRADAEAAAAGGRELVEQLNQSGEDIFNAFFDSVQEGVNLEGLQATASRSRDAAAFAARAGLLAGEAFDPDAGGVGLSRNFTSTFADTGSVNLDVSNITQDGIGLLTQGLTGEFGVAAQEVSASFFASIREIPGFLGENLDPEIRAALEAAAALAAETAEFETFDLDLVRTEFDTGQIGLDALVEGLETQLAIVQDLATAGDGNTEALAEALELQAEIQELRSSSIRSTFDLNEQLLGFGTDQGAVSPEAQISRLEGLIGDLSAAGDEEGAAEAAFELLALQQEILTSLADQAETEAEAISILNQGIAINPIAQVAVVRGLLANQEQAFTIFITSYLSGGFALTDAILDDLAGKIAQAGSAAGGLEAFLRQRVSDINSLISSGIPGLQGSDALREQLEFAEEDLGGLVDTEVPEINLGDTVGAADAARQRARAEAERAQTEAENLARQISDARFDLLQALFGGDPVRAAQISQDQARAQIAQAKNEAERIKGQAALVRADRSYEEAIRDITEAQVELALAFADYAGNAIEATEISLESARRRLAETQQDFQSGQAGQADVLRAEADVVRAEAAARDEQLNSQLSDFQFLFDMEQITKTQFIAYLQSLKQIPDLTTEQVRDIDRQIKQLRDDVQQDLQFNLPSTFRLPTLFEARRVDQATGGGVGFQDNRQVSVTMVVNNGMSQQQAADFLFDAIGGGPTTTTNRRF